MKNSISQKQIVREFSEAGRFTVCRYERETGKHASTYGGLILHQAFAELLRAANSGQLVLVFPADRPGQPFHTGVNNYETTKRSEHLAENLHHSFGSR